MVVKILLIKGVEKKHLNAIVDIVNSKTPTRDDRLNNLAKMVKIFKVEECNGNTMEKPLEEKIKWHDPVDNPICTLYMQSGNGGELGKHWGLFGKTRNGNDHVGLDLFAVDGTNVFACVDGTIYNRRWHGGYGNTLTIKVKNPKSFLSLKNNYKLQFENVGEMKNGNKWSETGDIYLFYAHLNSVKEFDFGDEVKCGEVIATTGRSGVEKGTCAPHLHFEILSSYIMGTGSIAYRINPAYFVKYKGYIAQSESEKKMQLDEKNKGKLVDFEGEEKLPYSDIRGFIK